MLDRLQLEEGWFTLLLVWGLVMTAAATVLNAEIIDGMEILPFIGTVAVVTGLALAKSRFSTRQAHLIALIYGLFLVIFLIGRSLPEGLTWQLRVVELFQRQAEWLQQALNEGSSRDGLIFVIHTSAVFWVLGYTAAWYTFRHLHIWRVVLPGGLVLLSVIYYYFGPKPLVGFLALYALIALIYIARTHLVAQERSWRAAAVRYESDIRLSFLQASFLAAVLALGLAWGLPTAQASTSVSDALGDSGLSDTWSEFQDDWTRLFASLRSYGDGTNDLYRDTLSLGGPRTVGSTLIMDVYVEERLPYVYWQAVSYDTYRGGRWTITADTEKVMRFPEEGQIDLAPYEMRQEVVQRVVNYVPNAGTIYGAPQPVLADRQMFVTQSTDGAGYPVVHSLTSRFVMRQGQEYEVVSSYSVADADMLRSAEQVYPDWIRERYLQAPASLTPETLELAAELTAPYDNAFDKAIAVRDYLRNNIAYNDQIPAPPPNTEPIHHILFEQREAYCNYYASAMTMMLRSQGVPARFVAGYAQGEWDEPSSSYRVRASNAHTWVEVFFPEYGWIQFEPTASLPVGDRPEGTGNPGDAFGNATAIMDDERPLLDTELPEDPAADGGEGAAAMPPGMVDAPAFPRVEF
ncbi:MAG: transglutaminase-like domain-containing protein, partial [Candidatus Promineifilaceae bacterium]|nr:transglutaminase-like domain-containing protein [Candidatus Promineifilaceae bacterium]